MLTIGNEVIQQDEYYVKYMQNGMDEVVFSLSIYDPIYKIITEESQIKDENGQVYLVKAIDAGKTQAKIRAQVDVDAWKAAMYLDYDSGSVTIAALANAVKPAGWTVVDSTTKTMKRTLRLEAATPLEVLDAARDVYGVTFRWNTKAKTLTIIDPKSYTTLGAYATRDLNLKEINYKGKSTGFATRLYAYGKDGLSFADINGGKPYVQNTDYVNKIVSAYWKDERYTVKANLLADAETKLLNMCVPDSSYECSILDLAEAIPDIYQFLDFSLFQVITLIDDIRDTKIDHQIVEYWKYPYYPEQNTIILSSTARRISAQLKAVQFELDNVTSVYNQNQAIRVDEAVASATDWITQGTGIGYVLIHRNAYGQPDELIIADDTDLTKQDTNVWRWNLNGLAFSSSGYNGEFGSAAILSNGHISADFVDVGVINANNGMSTLNMATGAFTLTGTNATFSFDGTNLTITGRSGGELTIDSDGNLTMSGTIMADAGEIGGFSIDASGNLAGANELKVGGMTLSGNTISGASSMPALKINGNQLTYQNIGAGETVYLLGMGTDGVLRLFDLYLEVIDAGGTETTGYKSTIYEIIPTTPGGTPPSPITPTYANAIQITAQGQGANLRTGAGTSYPSAGTVNTGTIYGNLNGQITKTTGEGYKWAIVSGYYSYNSGTGKYTFVSMGGTYYIAQTNRDGTKYYWNETQVQT